MHLIFGGAYQGKKEYAKTTFNIIEQEIFTCKKLEDCTTPEECIELTNLARAIKTYEKSSNTNIKVIDCLENFVFASVVDGIEATDYFKNNKEFWQDKVLILTDISQGIVPMQKEQREWREMNGRLMAYLAREAVSVTRIFCGLPQSLK